MNKLFLTVLLIGFCLHMPLSAQNIRTNNLVVSVPSSYIEFDPQRANSSLEAQLFTAIYEGLVSYDPQTLQVVPALAENWIISEDRTVYTFSIRQDAKFSDGSAITADTFYRTFLRLLNPLREDDEGSALLVVKGALAYLNSEIGRDELGLKVIDDYTLEITLTMPAPYFLKMLTHFSFTPISQTQPPLSWDEPLTIAFSGPFMITESTDSTLILEKNPFYWDKANVVLQGITFNFDDNAEQNTREYNQYLIDWAMPGTIIVDQVAVPNSVHVDAQFATSYFFFAGDSEFTQDLEVRQMLVEAMPLDLMRQNQFIAATSLVPANNNYPKRLGIEENFDEAVAAAKQLDPTVFETYHLTIASYVPNDRYALAIKDSWEKLGFFVDVMAPQDDEDYFEFVQNTKPTLALLTWIGDYLDPYAFLKMWLSQSILNFSIFKEASFDQLVESANYMHGQERLKTLADAEELLLKGGYVIPIGHPPSFNVIDNQVILGWYSNPLDLHPFKGLSISVQEHKLGRDVKF